MVIGIAMETTSLDKTNPDLEKIEIDLILRAIYQRYGYDFRNYSKTHLKRRILKLMDANQFENLSRLQHEILHNETFLAQLLDAFSVNTTEMFRNPEFYLLFRKNLVAKLNELDFLRIWIAGSSSGEEAYSLAITLLEEELYEKCQIYATDFNANILKKAKEAIYSIDDIKSYVSNYTLSGGKAEFSDYYTARYGSVIMNPELKKKILFAEHNLVTDSVFGEMDLIVCRNVLIYFNRKLQNRVINLFYDSLRPHGFLCLGSRETLQFTDFKNKFNQLDKDQRIFEKVN